MNKKKAEKDSFMDLIVISWHKSVQRGMDYYIKVILSYKGYSVVHEILVLVSEGEKYFRLFECCLC